MFRSKVVGMKRFEGNVDGKDLKSGKLYIEVRLDDSRNGEKQFSRGFFTEELTKVDIEIIKRIEHVTLPALFDIETERVGNGRESREVVIDARPVELVKSVAPVAPSAPKAA